VVNELLVMVVLIVLLTVIPTTLLEVRVPAITCPIFFREKNNLIVVVSYK
jgi:hypothetical protein